MTFSSTSSVVEAYNSPFKDLKHSISIFVPNIANAIDRYEYKSFEHIVLGAEW